MTLPTLILLAMLAVSCHAPNDSTPDSEAGDPWDDWTALTAGYYWGAPGTFSGSTLSVGPAGEGELALMVGSTADTYEGAPYDSGGGRLVRAPWSGGYLNDVSASTFRSDEEHGGSYGWDAFLPGDLTGDGIPDVAIPGTRTLSLFLSANTLGGDLVPSDADIEIAGENGDWYGAIADDANHDGQQDLISFPGIWYGPLAAPEFGPDVAVTYEISHLASRALTSGDPDGDGRANLLLSDPQTVFLLDDELPADGAVDPSVEALAAWEFPGAVVELISGSDLNGDGRDDIAVAEMDESTEPRQLTIYVLPDPTVEDATEAPIRLASLTGGTGRSALTSGDFDGDGQAELAVGYESSGFVFVFRGPLAEGVFDERSADAWLTGAAGLECWEECTGELCCSADDGGGFGASVAAGDLDGDGRDDLAIGQPYIGDEDAWWTGRVYIAWGGGLP